jgi:hypothetical protein
MTLGLPSTRTLAAEPEAARAKFFEAEVRPLLAENCVKCHGPAKQKGGLRLDSLAAAQEGGRAGRPSCRADLEESLLVEAINYEGLQMPPTGQLDARKRAVLTRWIEMGAPWPDAGAGAPGRDRRAAGDHRRGSDVLVVPAAAGIPNRPPWPTGAGRGRRSTSSSWPG